MVSSKKCVVQSELGKLKQEIWNQIRASIGGTQMTVQTFRDLLRAQPFKPFRLIMSSGLAYEVRHPEMAWLTRTDILVGIDADKEGVPSEFRICSLLHVTSVEPMEKRSAKAK